MFNMVSLVWTALLMVAGGVIFLHSRNRPPDWRTKVERTWRADHHLADEEERIKQVRFGRVFWVGFGSAFFIGILAELLMEVGSDFQTWLAVLVLASLVRCFDRSLWVGTLQGAFDGPLPLRSNPRL